MKITGAVPKIAIPTIIYMFIAIYFDKLEYNHSSLFAPLPEPTIITGVKAMTVAVLDLMKK